MNYFGELWIGYHSHHVSANPIPADVRNALAAEFHEDFAVKKNGSNCLYYDKWNTVSVDTANIKTWIRDRLREASGNNNFDVVEDHQSYHDQYTHYDDRVICEHTFKVTYNGQNYTKTVEVPVGTPHTATQILASARFDTGAPAP